MTMKMKNKGKKNSTELASKLSQKEIIKRINRSTRNSYKYFDLLISKKGYEPSR